MWHRGATLNSRLHAQILRSRPTTERWPARRLPLKIARTRGVGSRQRAIQWTRRPRGPARAPPARRSKLGIRCTRYRRRSAPAPTGARRRRARGSAISAHKFNISVSGCRISAHRRGEARMPKRLHLSNRRARSCIRDDFMDSNSFLGDQRRRCSGEHPWTVQNRGRIDFGVFRRLAPSAAALRSMVIENRAHTRGF